jgi:tRNA(adenine34) deaminase
MSDKNTALMQKALSLAQAAAQKGEVPIAAVLADHRGNIVAEATNRVERDANALAHAEMLVLNEALNGQHDKYLDGFTLAVTLEPCAMCAAALSHARVATVLFGAYDPKSGGTVNGARVPQHMHHKPTVIGGVLENDCADILKKFFAERR